jgi:hypothetical protein
MGSMSLKGREEEGSIGSMSSRGSIGWKYFPLISNFVSVKKCAFLPLSL